MGFVFGIILGIVELITNTDKLSVLSVGQLFFVCTWVLVAYGIFGCIADLLFKLIKWLINKYYEYKRRKR